MFLYPSGSRVAEGTVFLVSLYESFTSDLVYLSGCLTAFNFEEFNYAFHLSMKSYIYIYTVYIDTHVHLNKLECRGKVHLFQ